MLVFHGHMCPCPCRLHSSAVASLISSLHALLPSSSLPLASVVILDDCACALVLPMERESERTWRAREQEGERERKGISSSFVRWSSPSAVYSLPILPFSLGMSVHSTPTCTSKHYAAMLFDFLKKMHRISLLVRVRVCLNRQTRCQRRKSCCTCECLQIMSHGRDSRTVVVGAR